MMIGLIKILRIGEIEIQTLKYFLPQALGSVFFLVGVFTLRNTGGFRLIMFLGLLIKLGLFPFYAWALRLYANLGMNLIWFVAVPQKLLPFWILINWRISQRIRVIFFLGITILGVLVRVVNLFRQNRISLILGYSSFFNLSWALVAVKEKVIFWSLYILYGVSIRIFVYRQATTGANHGQDAKEIPFLRKIVIVLLLLNLAGLPPFVNIWRKVMYLNFFLNVNNFEMVPLFVWSSLGVLFCYLRIVFKGGFYQKIRYFGLSKEREIARLTLLRVFSITIFFL